MSYNIHLNVTQENLFKPVFISNNPRIVDMEATKKKLESMDLNPLARVSVSYSINSLVFVREGLKRFGADPKIVDSLLGHDPDEGTNVKISQKETVKILNEVKKIQEILITGKMPSDFSEKQVEGLKFELKTLIGVLDIAVKNKLGLRLDP